MIVLAFDACMQACSCALLRGADVLARRNEALARGHAERLAPMVAETLGDAGLSLDDIDRIGVTVGPGSFTGMRVGVATARGLALRGGGREIPVVGVQTLSAIAAGVPAEDRKNRVLAVISDARRAQVYAQAFDPSMRELFVCGAYGYEDAARRLVGAAQGRAISVVGTGVDLVRPFLESISNRVRESQASAQPDAVQVARLAADAPAPTERPRPLYVRPPDAKRPASDLS